MPTATRPGPDRRADRVAELVPGEQDACCAHLGEADATLVVSFDGTPREWLAARDVCADTPRFVATYPHPECVRVLADPGNLVGFALATAEFLDALPADATPAVCLDGLDAAMAYASAIRVARFLAVVVSRVRAAGGSVHCHSDGDAAAALPSGDVLVAE